MKTTRLTDHFEPMAAAAAAQSPHDTAAMPADAMQAYALASIAISLRRMADANSPLSPRFVISVAEGEKQ